ncbi:hypothetical protein N7447_008947 [Penicillium robsamsonii]|uniref:uncharacterized protein n=1 Tax=Penicillium robsamsonii TaxID=1792511 RepID=UPI002547D30F|nr:uncharacterized protein N7447_008947 [Penicillium robsamsonii]KAJ5816714.1 hypothetical protein N7447_008947 [Penicillium robsamsonii]
MRSSLVLLAGLAGTALAYPTDMAVERRTLGLLGELLGDITVDVTTILGAVLGDHSSVNLFAGLSAEAAAALGGGALGCKSGAIDHKAKAALKLWLLFHSDLDVSLKKSLISWCESNGELVLSADVMAALSVYIPTCADIAAKGQLYVTLDGIFEAASLESALVLSLGAQASLSAWIEAKLDLDLDVKVGLNVCAAGGVVGSLSADIKAALLAWLNSKNCDLSAHLKVSVLAWINGHAGGELVEIGALADTALSTISVGASIGAHIEESGLLSVGGQASLAAFLGLDLAADLAADVKLALEACAKGKLAVAVDLDIRTKLAIWLAGADCSLGVELKAVVLLWLSFAVEADVSVSLDLVGGLLGHVTDILTGTLLTGLSVDLRSALSLCAAGGSLTDLTLDARAELAAFLGGCTSIDIDISIQIIILEWFTGCSIPGAPSGPASSSVPSLPSSTPHPHLPGTSAAPSGPGASVSVSIPAGTPVPSGPSATTTPCDTETSQIVGSTVIPGGPNESDSTTVTAPAVPTGTGPVPTGPAPTGPAPSGPSATTTPCDTETSQIVGSTVIPGGPNESDSTTVTAPAVATGTGPVPTGPAPTGPAPSGPSATTTPCDTETSQIVGSTVIPGGPNESASTTISIPAGTPVPSGPAPSGPAPSGPSATTTTIPCDTETSQIVGSTVIPGGPNESDSTTVSAPAVPTGTGPAPSGPSATTTPCDTETSQIVGSTVIPGVPAPSGPAGTTTGALVPSGPAPTSPPTMSSGGNSGSDVVTITKTVTATVCGCE